MKSRIIFSYLTTLITILLTPQLSAEPAAKCNATSSIDLYGEYHGTPAAYQVWKDLFACAAAQTCTAIFEFLPASVNQDSELKDLYLKPFAVSQKTKNAIYGMDSTELKFIDIAAAASIRSRNGIALGRNMEQLFKDVFLDLDVKRMFRGENGLKQWKETLEAKEESDVIHSIPYENEQLKSFLLDFYKAATAYAEKSGIEYMKVDFENYGDADDDVESSERYMNESIGYRDLFMANALAKTICSGNIQSPIKVSIGRHHTPGVMKLLKQMLPQSEVQIHLVE